MNWPHSQTYPIMVVMVVVVMVVGIKASDVTVAVRVQFFHT